MPPRETWAGSFDSVTVDICHTVSAWTDWDRTSPSQVTLTDALTVLPDHQGFLLALIFTDKPPRVTGDQDSHGMTKPDYLSSPTCDTDLLQFKCEIRAWYCYCMGDQVWFIIIVVAQYRAAGVNGSGEREWKWADVVSSGGKNPIWSHSFDDQPDLLSLKLDFFFSHLSIHLCPMTTSWLPRRLKTRRGRGSRSKSNTLKNWRKRTLKLL